ncbi:Rieske 2Fe-2S domain-containing protein [Pseudomonas aeruginosa]|uniref:Rieske (2Fe-2S) protein n=1 Tax=Pseudomonas aeruginosa TaxID=287 RepID=UPI0005A753FA|nr:Rieske 2Fe-2S domain-containing protein [Pseudomonas aeruginosa]EJB8383518.1 Rieske 2Fe-2S domain-containing protein [Pseudomonas aeruginosa]KSS11679.1 4-nitrocatechol monooxygenase [Pseudomonas aeruginosa]MBG4982859.1 Rieske 2Fe-2S domain-containing protein [Pseudomonas aeruginosa]MBG5300557.1 Rieske 2Fe-2S domain-containing protein [Pseudomonas aeruginosa]MBG6711188.1 Rieske 2Fe-2S domain-containing protein [Pseudomonas aeruginosa]
MKVATVPLCALEEIPDGGARGLQCSRDGEQLSLVAVRRGEQVWVYRNRCPHFSVPLDFRPGEFCTYRRQVLMCAHHSALFRFEDGLCIDGPCAGAALESLRCRIEDGRLVLLGD